ncbi:hypothetical protein [Enterococcus dispar]|uniref:hypothetical protein n=1 Tax=Enterococcus dispar TaxID=44009 RepID=UPI0023311618|nr:hypothetical protein [Enterococcus dispar]WCG33196.1 hypothetical protein PML78_00475 [Enterococcus dispar]
MYMIYGKQRKITQVWTHIKRQHTGEKIVVVGFPKKLPENYLRNKQIIFYESLTIKDKWLAQANQFLAKFEDEYDGIIFYVDCTSEEANEMKKIAAKYRSLVTLTVASDSPISIEHHPLKQVA